MDKLVSLRADLRASAKGAKNEAQALTAAKLSYLPIIIKV
jgi:hypothetical protein